VGLLPPLAGGLECVALIDGGYAATFRFHDEPRAEGKSFVRHLKPQHGFQRVLLVSGDRESEVRYLAEKVGITEVHAGQSPEQKLALVREETQRANSVFMGDGINDAPALTAATVGIAFGQGSDVTAEAAGAVVMDSSLERVDELLHIGRRMRSIALQSAIGGMGLSMIGMFIAAADRCGTERGVAWVGGSVIAGPDGYPLAGPVAADQARILIAGCDLSLARDKANSPRNNVHADRRTELYGPVLSSPVLSSPQPGEVTSAAPA
jgi:cation transport ATPase